MKVALVHDYLNEFGGAERVLEALCEIYPAAPIYTAFYRKNSPAYRRFKNRKIITSWAQNVPFFASFLHSPLRFLAPLIWGGLNFRKYDILITSAGWFVTEGFGKKGDPSTRSARSGLQHTVEVCYCHTPPRYLYGYATATDIKRNFLTRAYALIVNHFMRVYDFEAAQRVDYFIANSYEVQSRIKKFYRRDSVVIYPPAFASSFAKASGFSEDKRLGSSSKRSLYSNSLDAEPYFLVVSRLVASKNVDVVVEVCAKLGLPLKVVGTGRELEKLKKLAIKGAKKHSRSEVRVLSGEHSGSGAKSTVGFLGDVEDRELARLYQNCRAVIFAASQEDFGIVPVEAMATGKPVIASAEGGVLESVIDAIPAGKGKGTGVYFDPPTAGSLTLAINNFVDLEKKGYFDAKFIKKHAQKFSKDRFKREILKFVEKKVR